MDTPLQQASTAKVTIGPFVSSTDGVTESTGLSPTVEVYKSGSTSWVTRGSTVAVAHQSKGWYEVPLSTGDTDTLGRLSLRVHSSSQHLPVFRHFSVAADHVYGGLVTTTDFLQTDAQQVGGATPDTSTDTASAVWTLGTTKAATTGTFGGEVQAHMRSTESVNVGSFDSGALGSSGLANSAGDAIADRFLGRNIKGSASTGRLVNEALGALRNKVTINSTAGTFTVFDTDDASTLFSGSVTVSTGGPVSEFDPA